MRAWQVRGGRRANENRVFVSGEVIMADRHFHLEVLADAADDRAERTLHLPIDTIVEHIKQRDCLVTDKDITIAKQLHEHFLDQLERFSIAIDLGDEQTALKLLNQLDLIDLLAAAEIFDELPVLLHTKRQ